ncbi:hypothetical protein M0805_001524 [Coniferiporia weirii]|nr:hypothetical protein M0805_001524 [Coniferiporia weirii]
MMVSSTSLGIFSFLHIIGGHVGIPLALVTMILTKTVRQRHPTLINLLVAWIVYATANLILVYSGEQRKQEPSHDLCLVQASLIYGSTVSVAAAMLALVLQLWMEFRGAGLAKNPRSVFTNIQLLLLPWVFFLFIGTGCIAYGIKNPSRVSIKFKFYCTLSSSAVIYVVCAFTLPFVATTLAFQSSVLWTLYKASRQFRTVNQTSYYLMLRATAATIYLFITFIVSIVIVLLPESIFAYLFIATLPLAIFLVFGTQKENLRAWLRLLRIRKPVGHIPLVPMTFKSSESQTPGMSSNEPVYGPDKQLPLTPPVSVLDSV